MGDEVEENYTFDKGVIHQVSYSKNFFGIETLSVIFNEGVTYPSHAQITALSSLKRDFNIQLCNGPVKVNPDPYALEKKTFNVY